MYGASKFMKKKSLNAVVNNKVGTWCMNQNTKAFSIGNISLTQVLSYII